MVEIPTNNTTNSNMDKLVEKVVNGLKNDNSVTLYCDVLNKQEAYELCDLFYKKGYHHEMRIHTNNYGNVFFYCVTISKTPICSDNARFAWSENVR